MRFATPIALALLGIVPLIAAFQTMRVRRRSKHAVRFTNLGVLESAVKATPPWGRRVSATLFLVALAFLALAAAKPRRVVAIPRDQAAVILALDTSGSMIASDVKPNRAKAAEDAALLFIRQVPSTVRMAVVRFHSVANVAAPMSIDRVETRAAVSDLFPNGATALGDAIAASLLLDPYRRLSDEDRLEAPPTVIVLLTDGSNSFSELAPLDAAQLARDQGVPIHAITIGPPEGETARETELSVDPPNHGLMRRIAEVSGGRYYSAPTRSELRDIYATLATTFHPREKIQEISFMFVGGALVLLLAGAGFSVVRAGRFP